MWRILVYKFYAIWLIRDPPYSYRIFLFIFWNESNLIFLQICILSDQVAIPELSILGIIILFIVLKL